MHEVASKTLTAETPPYEVIMDLDRKVREFPIPPDAAALQEDMETPPDSEPPPLQESMIRFVLAHSREVSECRPFPCLSLIPFPSGNPRLRSCGGGGVASLTRCLCAY